MQTDIRQNPKKPTDRLKRALEGLLRRPFLRLSALFIAIVFWAVVIASDPARMIEKTISASSVAIYGMDALKNRGLTVTSDLTSKPIQVKMRVEVKQINYDAATAESFLPRLDLSQQVTAPGRQTVRFSAGNTSIGTVLSFEPESIEIDVEPYTPRKLVPVVVELTGEAAEPLWVATPSSDPAQIVISGPKSVVDTVKRAVVSLDRALLSTSRPNDSLTEKFELVDADGNTVRTDLLSVSSDSIAIDSVTVDVDVYPMREIPIATGTAVVGTPAHGYALSEVRVTPGTVLVAADQETLRLIDALHIASPVDITDMNATEIVSSALQGASDFRYVSAPEVLVEAEIVPAVHVHTYAGLKISVMGLSPDYSAKLSHERTDCVLSGSYLDLEGLSAADIHLYVDAAGLGEGKHTLPVLCRVDGVHTFDYIAAAPEITVTLSKTIPR